ncbi:MAG: vitamin K epoxide reductase family protein [bacterium]|nr:vitamin K epoxide reductase family protein [bacterium]
MKIYRILAILFAFAGLGIMIYLTYLHYANAQSFCDFSAEVSCDVVTTSIYSEVFGIPMSLLGIGFFSLLIVLLFFYKKDAVFQSVFFLALFMLVPSFYLTFIEVSVIKAFCVLCESSKVTMIGILIISFLAARKTTPIPLRNTIPIIIGGLLVVGITYFAQMSGGTKEDYSELFLCANDNQVIYYKSVRCSSCRRQEQVFGPAYSKLQSIECHPDGDNPQPELCLEKNITKTPTFIIERDGVEVKRAIGIQQIPEFADFAGCSVSSNE